MAPAALSHLFSPIRIRGLEIKNRILSTGHDTTLITGGVPNDALIAYHEARAKGGAGLIVVQAAGIHETAKYTSHVLMASEASVPGYRQLAETVHKHGCKIFGQLFHPGPRDHGKPGRQRAGRLCAVGGAERALPCHAAADEQGDDRGRHQGLWRIRAAAARRRAGRVRDRGEPRLSAGAVPQSARQPARRQVWRIVREPPALPARGDRLGARACRRRDRRRPPDQRRREGSRGPGGIREPAGDRRARRPGGLRQRDRRLVRRASAAPCISRRRWRSPMPMSRRSRRR